MDRRVSVVTYIPGQVYTFTAAVNKTRYKHDRRLVYVGQAPSQAIGGLEIFRSATATWQESFTREQLGDFSSIVAEEGKKKAAAETAARKNTQTTRR